MNIYDYFMFAVVGLGFILQGFFIVTEHKEKYVLADVLKGLASLCFVFIGLIGKSFIYQDNFGKFIFLGLVFGLIGDVVMNLRFILKDKKGQIAFLAGIFAFLVGHAMYLVALIPKTTHLWQCVVIGLLLAGALLAYIFKTMEVKKAFKIFGVLYVSIIFVMVTVAIDIALFVPLWSNNFMALGAMLFATSDVVLIFNTFNGKTTYPMRIANLSLYYLGQMLIAFCLYIKN